MEGKQTPKKLEVTVENCENYNVEVFIGTEKIADASSVYGTAEVAIEKVPTEEKMFAVILSADGMNNYKKTLKLKLEETQASDLKVFFINGDDNAEKELVAGSSPTFSTTKDKGKIKVTTKDSLMSKVVVDGNEAVLSEDKKTATYDLPITVANNSEQSVNVEIEFDYFKKAKRMFKVAKYATKDEFPLRLLDAKIFSGDKGETKTQLNFTEDNKVSVEIGDVRYSTVELLMEFDAPIEKREVLKCEDERSSEYGKKLGDSDSAGIFSGYVTADIDITKNDEETPTTNIKDNKYYEVLIVGAGTVRYEVKVTSKTQKDQTYTIEIKNTFDETPDPNNDSFLKNIVIFNGKSGRPIFYSLHRFLNLPHYAKGSTFKDKILNPNGFEDLAYMDSVGMVMIYFKPQTGSLENFALFYNVMEEESGNPKNKHEFKRIYSGVTQAQDKALVRFNIEDMNNKYFDMFVSNEKNTPYPMLPTYYGKKWRKTSVKHGFLIGLQNKNKFKWIFDEPVDNPFFFSTIFNYRIQSIVYDNLNKNSGGSEPKELVIAKKQKFIYWESGEEITAATGNSPLLSGKKDDNKDVFTFEPIFDTKKFKIKEVKYTIKKKKSDQAGQYEEESNYKDKVAKIDESKGYYTFGEGSYTFEDNNVYKIEVKVTYDGDNSEDKFNYMIDYKTEQTLNLMDIAEGGEDLNQDFFGVPISYATKVLNPAIFEKISEESLTRSFPLSKCF